MNNYRLLIQYDGTRYNGWQRLKDNDNTIQGKIEDVLSKMVHKPTKIIGASRTDAGVHAKGQVANVFLENEISEMELKNYLNHYLPSDIEILEVKAVADRFHSRLNAGNKTYVYRISTTNQKHVFERKYLYDLNENLNIDKMKEAAKFLIGEHDFQSFCARKMKKSSVRTLEKIEFHKENGILNIIFTGSGFLYHMIRILVGTLIEVGLGTRKVASISDVMMKKERSEAGYLVPGKGLCLLKINY